VPNCSEIAVHLKTFNFTATKSVGVGGKKDIVFLFLLTKKANTNE
jgi:hypothetical protein